MPDRQGNTVTVRDWLSDCRRAEAHDLLDKAVAGAVAVENLLPPVVYEFSNGRKFRDTPGAAGPWPTG